MRDLQAEGAPAAVLDARTFGHYTGLTWHKTMGHLAFLAATEDEDGKPGAATLWMWDGRQATEVVADAPDGWMIPARNSVRWTDDGERLFFGYRPAPPEVDPSADDDTIDDAPFDPYDLDAILADRTVDVWHWNDSLINPQQKKQWQQSQNWTYDAVYHRSTGRAVALADLDLRSSDTPQNDRVLLARSNTPYQKEVTWEGSFFDAYVVGLDDGQRTKFADRLSSTTSLSPGGRYVVYYDDHHWHRYDTEQGTTQNLTAGLGVPLPTRTTTIPATYRGMASGVGWAMRPS